MDTYTTKGTRALEHGKLTDVLFQVKIKSSCPECGGKMVFDRRMNHLKDNGKVYFFAVCEDPDCGEDIEFLVTKPLSK